MPERVCLTSLDFDWKLFPRKKDSEEENAEHLPALEEFTELVQRLTMKVLPDSRPVCFACAECTTSPKVQQSCPEEAQGKKKKITDFFTGNHYNDANDHLPTVTIQKTLEPVQQMKSEWYRFPSSVAVWALRSLVCEPLWTSKPKDWSKPLS